MGTAEQQEAVQGIMPKLTSARTLREIADLIAGSAGTTSAVAPPTAAPVAPAVSTAPGRDFTTELRAVAAERTGYPPEMLDLDAGIESDLGIDSIKRVEILTALQKLGSPKQQQAVQAIMAELTSARTLREIAELIGGAAGSGSAPPAAAAAGRDFVTELRAVAAERTGYPPEMLDLDAGIESDLGIDSIKRVEILTALQKLGSPEQQESVQAIMNKLTSARTLREIAELIASCAGAGAPVQAAATVAAPAVASGAPAGRDFVSELRAVAAERT